MAKSANADAAPQTTDDLDRSPGPARPLAAPDEAADDGAHNGAPPSDAEQSDRAEVEGAPTSGADNEPEAPALPLAQAPTSAQAHPSNLAEVSAQLRLEAAEIADIAAQASRLGIAVDAAKALREGTKPDALRRTVLDRAAALADAQGIVAAAPSPVVPRSAESPIVAAAKRAATDTSRR